MLLLVVNEENSFDAVDDGHDDSNNDGENYRKIPVIKPRLHERFVCLSW